MEGVREGYVQEWRDEEGREFLVEVRFGSRSVWKECGKAVFRSGGMKKVFVQVRFARSAGRLCSGVEG